MRALLALLLSFVLTGPSLAASEAAPAAPVASAAQAQPALVDINRASVDELKALKGIGNVRAAAIVNGRPYARKDDLVRRRIVPPSVYEEIREQIVARQ